jgi:hypothetical protein
VPPTRAARLLLRRWSATTLARSAGYLVEMVSLLVRLPPGLAIAVSGHLVLPDQALVVTFKDLAQVLRPSGASRRAGSTRSILPPPTMIQSKFSGPPHWTHARRARCLSTNPTVSVKSAAASP